VGRVNVNTGKYVSPTEVLFELVNPEDIHLSLNVFEKDINDLALGQKVTAYTNSNPDKRYPCEIILIGKEVLEDHSINVHCHFDSYDNKLVPGTFMNAEISQQKKEVWAIPLACVQQFEGKHYIFLKEGEAFSMQEVKIGISNESKVEILEVPTSWRDKEIAENGSYSLLMKLKNAAEEE
jgi:cobalt-zinc-cadmium efflux system membrane fusion protein